MKLLILLALAPLLSFAQKKVKIANHSNVILLRGVTKDQLKDSLRHSGFTVVDRDSLSFETLPRQYKILEHGNLIIKCSVTDTALVMTGIFNQVANNLLLAPYGNKWKQARKTALATVEGEAFEILRVFANRQPATINYAKVALPPVEVK